MITSGFFNSVNGDRKYNAEQVGNMFEGLISEGVFESVGDKFKVEPNSGMTVSVGTGRAVLDTKWVKSDTASLLNITAAHPSLPRYTIVVLRHVKGSRLIVLATKDGTAATNPSVPGVTRDANSYEICLAKILVPAAAVTIRAQDITDTRLDSTVCGYVTGLIDQVDTSTIFDQWEDAYSDAIDELEATNESFVQSAASMMANERASFMAWFDDLAANLQVETYVQRYECNTTFATVQSTTIPYTALTPNAYEYSSQDVITVHINGLLAKLGTDYTVGALGITFLQLAATSTAEINVEILKSRIGHNQEATGSVQTITEFSAYPSGIGSSMTVQGDGYGTAYVGVGVMFDADIIEGDRCSVNGDGNYATDMAEESWNSSGENRTRVNTTVISAWGDGEEPEYKGVVEFTAYGSPMSTQKCICGLYHFDVFDRNLSPSGAFTLVDSFFNNATEEGGHRLANALKQVILPPSTTEYNSKYILVAFCDSGSEFSAAVQGEDITYCEVIGDSLTEVVPKHFTGNDVSGNIISSGGLIVGSLNRGASRTVIINIRFPQNADVTGYLLYRYEP